MDHSYNTQPHPAAPRRTHCYPPYLAVLGRARPYPAVPGRTRPYPARFPAVPGRTRPYPAVLSRMSGFSLTSDDPFRQLLPRKEEFSKRLQVDSLAGRCRGAAHHERHRQLVK
eukprot:7381278-Prymnesium_polylepis.2